MFENIGSKLKWLAMAVCALGMLASLVFAVTIWMQKGSGQDTTLLGIIVLVLGCLASWVGSFFTYGFGELIENTNIIIGKLNEPKNAPADSIPHTDQKGKVNGQVTTAYKPMEGIDREKKILDEGGWKCPACKRINHSYVSTCSCGMNKREAMQAAEKPNRQEE